MQCGQSIHLLNVKLVVHHVTSRLSKVKQDSQCTYNVKLRRVRVTIVVV